MAVEPQIIGQLDPIKGWKMLTILLNKEAGIEVIPESIVIDKRRPHEYPEYHSKQDEQVKCK